MAAILALDLLLDRFFSLSGVGARRELEPLDVSSAICVGELLRSSAGVMNRGGDVELAPEALRSVVFRFLRLEAAAAKKRVSMTFSFTHCDNVHTTIGVISDSYKNFELLKSL